MEQSVNWIDLAGTPPGEGRSARALASHLTLVGNLV